MQELYFIGRNVSLDNRTGQWYTSGNFEDTKQSQRSMFDTRKEAEALHTELRKRGAQYFSINNDETI